MRLVVPFGFYGSGNIGDEATLNGFARLLESVEGDRVTAAIGSRNPSHTARVEPAFSYFRCAGRDPRRWWAKLRADACVFAGGTPISDGLGDWPLCEVLPIVRAARRRGQPIIFVGIGTENLKTDRARKLISEELAPAVSHWSVRCEKDRARLSECGVTPQSITTAADMAWLLPRSDEALGRTKLRSMRLDRSRLLVAVNLVNEGSILVNQPHLAREIAASLDALIDQRGAKILFLANEVRPDATFDLAAAMLVMSQMRRQRSAFIAPPDYLAPAEMMSIIGCCDLAISMRYHFCLFAAIQGKPFVAITRSDKVADLCWDLEWNATVAPAQFSHAAVDRASEMALSEIPSEKKIAQLRRRALENTAAIEAVSHDESIYEESLGFERK